MVNRCFKAKIIVYCFRSAECFFHGLHGSLCNTIVVGSWTNFRLSICSCFVTQYIVVFNVTWSCSNKPSSSSSTLRCEEWNSMHWGTGGRSWTSYKFSLALRAVLSVLLHFFFCLRFLITYLYRCSALTNWASKPAESWSLIVGNIPAEDEGEMMNIWISYIWTAELKKQMKRTWSLQSKTRHGEKKARKI